MAYRIKVQDGIISYSAADPDDQVTYNIDGTLNVASKVNIGEDSSPISTITSTKDIVIDSGTIGAVRVEPESGFIFLNGVSWPLATTGPVSGMYIGASAANTLEYQRFIIGSVVSDNETSTSLSNLFPNAHPGQSVYGPSVLYTCVETGIWRAMGFGQMVLGTANSDNLTSLDLDALFPSAIVGQIVVGPNVLYIFVGSGWRTVGTPENQGAVRVKVIPGDYTLEITDVADVLITIDSASASNVFVPSNSSVALPVGSIVMIGRNGTGTVTLVPDSGVVIRTPETLNINKQYGRVTLIKVDDDIWEVDGNLEPI